MKTFKELGLNAELLKTVEELGFTEPSPIQVESIPFLLESEQDLTALAQTGTGKTAAFSLPILQKLKADSKTLQAIVLCPTRELCIQSAQGITEFARHTKGVVVTPVYGGERIDLQIRQLRRGTNIVVGTPGRVSDLIRRNVLKLGNIKWVVLDEADEMLDMGFKEDLDKILKETPKERQTLLFSATMSKSVASIAKKYMKDAHEISVGDKNIGAENVTHEYYVVNSRDRFEALKRILDYIPDVYGILFCRTRRETQEVADKLRQANYEVEAIHGEVSQDIRTKIMARFKKKQIRVLVATDVAARGIDVKNLTHVINYNLPDSNAAYTHRSGRTGRAGEAGISVVIAGPRDIRTIKELERIIGKPFEYKKVPDGKDIYKKLIDNFVEGIKNADIEKIGQDKYVSEVVERLKAVNKENLVSYFVHKELTPLIEDHKSSRDLNASARFSEGSGGGEKGDRGKGLANGVNLKINLGRKHRFDIKALFSLINSTRSLSGLDIGRIDLMPEYSVFAVDPKWADKVIDLINGTKFHNTTIQITKADPETSFPKTSYSRGGGSRSGGGAGHRGGGNSSRRSGGGGPRRSGGGGRSRSGGGSDRKSRGDTRNDTAGSKSRSPFRNKRR